MMKTKVLTLDLAGRVVKGVSAIVHVRVPADTTEPELDRFLAELTMLGEWRDADENIEDPVDIDPTELAVMDENEGGYRVDATFVRDEDGTLRMVGQPPA
jgi:hypothetical protein